MLNLLNVLQELCVDALLDGSEFLSPLLLVGFACLSKLHSVLGGVLELVLGESLAPLEEGVIDVGSHTVKGDASGGSQDVGGIDAAKRNSVDAVGTGHEEVAGGESFEDDHSAASVGAGEKNHHGSRLDRSTSGGSTGKVALALDKGLLVVSRVPGLGAVSESALGCTAESYVMGEILRWEVEGLALPLRLVRWTGVARK